MNITKEQLKQIIKEELEAVLHKEEVGLDPQSVLAAYKDYAENKIGADINYHKPVVSPDGVVHLPRWAKTGSFERFMRNALGDENLSYEEIKNAVLDAIGFEGE